MGFSLGGLAKSVFNPLSIAQLAMGPAGWASLAATAMKTIGSQLAMNLIQNLGQQMGLPQPMIDLAQGAFANASGQPGLMRQNFSQAAEGFAQQLDLRPSERGLLQRELENAGDKSLENLMKVVQGIQKRSAGASEEDTIEGKGSFLVAIAKALGKSMDEKAAKMKGLADEISAMTADKKAGVLNGVNANNKDKAQAAAVESTKISSKTTLLQAYSQELSMVSNAASNVIKSIGEANVTNARKG